MAEGAKVNGEEVGESQSDRPLVTFALFAYNQEDYVGEAIAAAFAQTYSPLEIILSDDCSSDRTFAIMQEMAAGYTGPHRVIARQSPQNRLVLRHVMDVAQMAQGRYMVVAAGDDISRPHRTEKLVELFESEAADFCWSAYEALDENHDRVSVFEDDFAREAQIFDLSVQRIHGAMAAYRLTTIVRIPEVKRPIFYEDQFFEIYTALTGLKVSFCSDRLVQYRILPHSLSLRRSTDGAAFEDKLATHYRRQGETALLALDCFATPAILAQRPELEHFRQCAEFHLAVSGWRELGLMERIRLLRRAPSRKIGKWFLPRAILGARAFIQLKNLQLAWTR